MSFKNLDEEQLVGHGPQRLAAARSQAQRLRGFNIFKMVTDGGSQSALSSNAVTWSYAPQRHDAGHADGDRCRRTTSTARR